MTTLGSQIEQPRSLGERGAVTTRNLSVIFAVIGLCVLIPAWLFSQSPNSVNDSPWGYALVMLLWAGVRLSWLFGRAKPYLYSVVVWVFIYIFFGMAPLLQLRLGVSPNTTPQLIHATLEPAFWVIIVGTAAMELGMLIREHKTPSAVHHGRELAPRRAFAFGIAALVIAAVVVTRVGPGSYFSDRNALIAARQEAWGASPVGLIAQAAAIVFPLVAAHALFRLRQRDRQLGRAPSAFLLAWTLLAVVLLTVNIVTSARITFGTSLLSLLILAGSLASPTRVRATIGLLLAGLVFVFPISDIGRGQSAKTPLTSSGDYDAYAQVANTIAYVHTVGVSWGSQILGAPLFWVPRSIWPDKPIDTGTLVATFRGYNFRNLSSPFWAEGYVNFGYVGAALFMFVLGYLARRGDQNLTLSMHTYGVSVVAGAVLPFFMLIILRGPLIQSMGEFVAFGLALWAVSKPRQDSAGPPDAVGPTQAVTP